MKGKFYKVAIRLVMMYEFECQPNKKDSEDGSNINKDVQVDLQQNFVEQDIEYCYKKIVRSDIDLIKIQMPLELVWGYGMSEGDQ